MLFFPLLRLFPSSRKRRSFIFFSTLIPLLLFGFMSSASVPISLYKSFAGHINFTGTGGSLRTQPNGGDPCAVTNSGSAALSGIPTGATIRAAYLYYAGSYAETTSGSTQTAPDYDITFEGNSYTASRMFTEDYLGTDEKYFCGFVDVTSDVAAKGNGTYTFADLSVNTGDPHCGYATVLAGWTLVVIYEKSTENFRVINIHDGLEVFYGSVTPPPTSITITHGNFHTPSSGPLDGQQAHITWEGDDTLNGNESLQFDGNELTDGDNPSGSQYNSTINLISSTTSYGVDFDSYPIGSYLTHDQTSATTYYQTGGDMVLLSTMIMSVINDPAADLQISKTHTGSFQVGDTAVYSIEVKNNGPSDDSATDITVTDTLPTGLTYLSSSGSGWTADISAAPVITWTHSGPLSAGDTLPLLTLNATVGDAAYPSVDNTASVSSPTFDNDATNDTVTDTTTITAIADLAISKSHAADFAVGSVGTYTINVANNGPNNMLGATVTVTDTLPSGLTYNSSSGTGWVVNTSAAPVITWTWTGDLAAGNNLPAITLNVDVAAAAMPNVTNEASVVGTYVDDNPANDTVSDITNVSSLAIAKTSTDADHLVQAGDMLPYQITVTNNGTGTTHNVIVSDSLPAHTSYIAQSTVATVTFIENYRDEFNAQAYNNSDGSLAWTSSWQEFGDDNNVTRGDEQVMSDPDLGLNYILRVRDNDGGGEGVQRTVDLSGYDRATLSFEYRRRKLDTASDYVEVRIYDGSSWTTLDTFAGPDNDANYVPVSYDITPYMNAGSQIQFISSSSLGGRDMVYFDNVDIHLERDVVMTNQTGDPNPLADGVPPNLVTAADGIDLVGGQTLTVKFLVQVENPLDAAIEEISNAASSQSTEITTPVNATTADYVPHLESYESDYTTVDNLFRRDPDNTGKGTDPLYVGGPKYVPDGNYDVAYYDAAGVLQYTDTTAGAQAGTGRLQSTNPNTIDAIRYGTWTAVTVPDGTTPQATLGAQLADPSTITSDTFSVRSWAKALFTDSSGAIRYGYDTTTGSATAYFRILDADQNLDPTAIDTLTIIVSDSKTGDSETITLYESGVNTGEFTNDSSGSRFGLLLSSSSGSGSNDGILRIQPGHNIDLAYTDPQDPLDAPVNQAFVPTLVVLSSFTGRVENGIPTLRWKTAAEVGTIGFYLCRLDPASDTYKKINTHLLPAALISGRGGSYSLTDPSAVAPGIARYRLVEVEKSGNRHGYGPFDITFTQSNTGTGTETPRFRRHPYLPAATRACTACRARRVAEEESLPAPALKLLVKETGLYYVSAAAIATPLGISTQRAANMIQSGRLQLTQAGEPIAFLPALRGAGFYFYGEAANSQCAAANVYRLTPGKHGVRMRFRFSPNIAAAEQSQVTTQQQLEQNKWYVPQFFHDPLADYWMWDFLIAGDPTLGTKTFSLPVADPLPAGEAKLTVSLLSASEALDGQPDHHVEIELNGTPIGESTWDGIGLHSFVCTFDQSLLQNDDNQIRVRAMLDTGAPYSIVYVNSFNLERDRVLQAENDRLVLPRLPIAEPRRITVSGFSAPPLVLDLQNPRQPTWIVGAWFLNRHPQSISLVRRNGAPLLLAAPAAARAPAAILPDYPSSLHAVTNAADYLIISPRAFFSAANDLADYRRDQGLIPKVIDLDDIMDEFSDGIYDPSAIRRFLVYAWQNWATAPRYVLLAGKGTIDCRDLQGHHDNLVPTLYVDTPDGLFSSDWRFGDVENNDDRPEIAVGRLPARTVNELQQMVDKIRTYESTPTASWQKRVIMLADNADSGGEFPTDSADLIASLPPAITAVPIVLDPGDVATARTTLFNELDNGALLLNFIGHAALDRLTAEGVLLSTDVGTMNNAPRLPILAGMTCLVGHADMPGYSSLSERLMRQVNGGAIAVWAPTGLSINPQAIKLDADLFQALFTEQKPRLGDAVLRAFQLYLDHGGDAALSRIYNLQGDPALRIAH